MTAPSPATATEATHQEIATRLNLTEATAYGAAMVGVFNSIDHTVPKNAGAFRRLRVHLREGCVSLDRAAVERYRVAVHTERASS